MKTPQENLIDAIGEISDKNVMLAAGITSGAELHTDVRGMTAIEVEQPVIRKSHKIRNAVIGGAAAAVAITGGLFAWSRLRPVPTEPTEPAQSSVSAEVVPVTYDTPMRALKWGMSESEVKLVETAELSEEQPADAENLTGATLIYENVTVPVLGYNSRMELSFEYRLGLHGINYYIPSENCEELYNELTDKYTEMYGDPERLSELGFIWQFPDEGYSIYIYGYTDPDTGEGEVQFAYWQLLPDEVYDMLDKEREAAIYDSERPDNKKYVYYDLEKRGQENMVLFRNYFYGKWVSDDGEVLNLNYSDTSVFSYHNDIYLEAIYEVYDMYDQFMVFNIFHEDGNKILRIDVHDENTLYEYRNVPDEGKDRDDYDVVYHREETEETDRLNMFGYLMLDTNTTDDRMMPTDIQPIDKTLDCEKILLEDAEALRNLVSAGWHNYDTDMQFELGERDPDFTYNEGAYKVISDEVHTYDDVREKYGSSISKPFIDYTTRDQFLDINGELYWIDPLSGYLGTYESWYLGFDVKDDKIIGHFAALKWGNGGEGDAETKNAEFLNNTDNYDFYDITVKNVGGEYVITDCRTTGEGHYPCPDLHGLFYNNGSVDRSLITNPDVMPGDQKTQVPSEFTEDEQKEIQLFLADMGKFWADHIDGWGGYIDYSTKKTGTAYADWIDETIEATFYRSTVFTSMRDLEAAAKKYLTDNMYTSIYGRLSNIYEDFDDGLYAVEWIGDGGMFPGIDYVCIQSAERIHTNAVQLVMHAHGSAANWTEWLDKDRDDYFTVTLVKTDDGYRVDEYSDGGNDYIARFYTVSSRDNF